MTFTYERRLATFRHFNWPHSSSTETSNPNSNSKKQPKYKSQPEDFAQAGFYCRPLVGSIDTVACFMCLKSLDGWEVNDSAWEEHKSHSSTCPLVTLNLQTSRLKTFDKWPGSGAKIKGGVVALAAAGFFHFPKSDTDDTCICYQCGLALDGWENDDDPQHEHSRRRPNCPHVFGNQFVSPASFDFILAGQPDDLAIKDLRDLNLNETENIKSFTDNTKLIPSTPTTIQNTHTHTHSHNTFTPINRRKLLNVLPVSQVKSKKIRISSSTPMKNSDGKKFEILKKIFPQLCAKNVLILNWTMEEFLERLVSDNVRKFEEEFGTLLK